MPVKSIRFSDSLAAAYQARADELDRSFSWVVLRTLESAQGSVNPADTSGPAARRVGSEGGPTAQSSASSRAPTEKPVANVLGSKVRRVPSSRQAALNKAKGL